MSHLISHADSLDPLGDHTDDPAPVSTGFQIMLVLAALGLVILIAGVPGLDPVAGNGSEKLRKGWAAERQATANASQDTGSQPSGSVDPNGENR